LLSLRLRFIPGPEFKKGSAPLRGPARSSTLHFTSHFVSLPLTFLLSLPVLRFHSFSFFLVLADIHLWGVSRLHQGPLRSYPRHRRNVELRRSRRLAGNSSTTVSARFGRFGWRRRSALLPRQPSLDREEHQEQRLGERGGVLVRFCGRESSGGFGDGSRRDDFVRVLFLQLLSKPSYNSPRCWKLMILLIFHLHF